MEDEALIKLKEIHNKYWVSGNIVGKQTSLARNLTSEWQAWMVNLNPDRYVAEFIVNKRAGSKSHKIDLVDISNKTAYELKVSPNNPHFEFYKDVFKIMYANESHKIIDKLIFCCPEDAMKKLGDLAIFVTKLSAKLDLEIEIFCIKAAK